MAPAPSCDRYHSSKCCHGEGRVIRTRLCLWRCSYSLGAAYARLSHLLGRRAHGLCGVLHEGHERLSGVARGASTAPVAFRPPTAWAAMAWRTSASKRLMAWPHRRHASGVMYRLARNGTISARCPAFSRKFRMSSGSAQGKMKRPTGPSRT